MRFLLILIFIGAKGYATDIKRDVLRVFHWTDFESSVSEQGWLLSVYLDDEQKISMELVDTKQKIEYKLSPECRNDSLIGINIDKNLQIRLKASGEQDKSVFSGFMKNESVKINLSFHFRSRSSGELENRYFRLYGSDSEIEAFGIKIQQSIIEDDRVWLSTAIQYPMNIEVNTGNILFIQTRQQFMESFNKIFDPAFKDKILGCCSINMKSDELGVDMGKGWIKINNTKKSTEKKHQLTITQIRKS
jgi:hypothetical protein